MNVLAHYLFLIMNSKNVYANEEMKPPMILYSIPQKSEETMEMHYPASVPSR